jgi:myo-inositol-1(or 4)-monophosphatase
VREMHIESTEYYKMLARVAGEAAAFLRDHACQESYSKVVKGDTIRADVEAENYIIDVLKAEGFRGVIVSEERGKEILGGESNLILVIDPLDGSTNYRHCIPWCSVSLALFKREDKGNYELMAGSIAPVFYGSPMGFAKDYGCFIGMKKVSGDKEKGNLLFVYADKPEQLRDLSLIINLTSKKYKNVKVRSLGSAALELAYVALGKAVLFADLRSTLRNVDVAAAAGMIRECGGEILDSRGMPVSFPLDDVKKLGTILASIDKELLRELVSKRENIGSAGPAS